MEQQYQQLSGKTVLVIGSCGFARQPIFKKFKDLNLKIVLVDTEEDSYAKDLIHSFVKYQIKGGNIDADEEIHKKEIIELLGDTVNQLNGCFTFFDEYLYLTALLCRELNFTGINPESVELVKSKQNTNDILKADPDTDAYAPLSFRIQNEIDLSKIEQLKFPAVLKPEHGYFSTGVTEVLSHDDCVVNYRKVREIAKDEEVRFGNRYGSSMVLMEFLTGNSYPVEVIMFGGELLKGIPSAMGPKFRDVDSISSNAFSDTTTCSASGLCEDLENELINSGYKICKKIGLNNGVFNVEMKLTESGFKLIEVNGRPGSFRRCAVFSETRGVDIFIIQALISCGIKPFFPEIGQKFSVGCYLYAFIHGHSLTKSWIREHIETLRKAKQILFTKEFESVNDDRDPYPIPFVHLSALGDTVHDAKTKLINICNDLQFSNDDFNVENLTESFK